MIQIKCTSILKLLGIRRKSTSGEAQTTADNHTLIKDRARSLSTSGKPAGSSGKRKIEATMGDAEDNITASLSEQPAAKKRMESESTNLFVDAMRPLLANLESSLRGELKTLGNKHDETKKELEKQIKSIDERLTIGLEKNPLK